MLEPRRGAGEHVRQRRERRIGWRRAAARQRVLRRRGHLGDRLADELVGAAAARELQRVAGQRRAEVEPLLAGAEAATEQLVLALRLRVVALALEHQRAAIAVLLVAGQREFDAIALERAREPVGGGRLREWVAAAAGRRCARWWRRRRCRRSGGARIGRGAFGRRQRQLVAIDLVVDAVAVVTAEHENALPLQLVWNAAVADDDLGALERELLALVRFA